MTIGELIKRLQVYNPEMEVFATDGNYLKPFCLFNYTGDQLTHLDYWDENMVSPDNAYLVIVLED